MTCPTPIGYQVIGSQTYPISCDRWDCEVCGKLKKWHVAEKAKILFQGVDIVKQVTLTQVLGSRRNIMKDWKEFRRVLARAGVKLGKFFWTKEFTRKGQRHLHIIAEMPGYVDQKWLSDVWRKITKGESYRVWINETDIKNAAGYVMKYLTKSFSKECRFHPGENRFGFSRGAVAYQYPYTPILGSFWEIIVDPNMKPQVVIEYHACDYMRVKKRSFVRDDEYERGLKVNV